MNKSGKRGDTLLFKSYIPAKPVTLVKPAKPEKSEKDNMNKSGKRWLILLAVSIYLLYLSTESIFMAIILLFLVLAIAFSILYLRDRIKLSLKRCLSDIVQTSLSDKDKN